MPDTVNTETPIPAAPEGVDPYEILESFAGAPSRDQIQAWKNIAPGGRVRIFCPDKTRCYIVRPVSALEMKKVAAAIPANSQDRATDEAVAMAVLCCYWTNSGTSGGRLDEQILRGGPAGLPYSLHQLILHISDFYDQPILVRDMSADL